MPLKQLRQRPLQKLPSKNTRKDDNIKVWFLKGLFNQKKFYENFSDPLALYMLLRSNVIRGNMKTPMLKKIKYEYYDIGYLVCALSYREIAAKTGWSNYKIETYIDKLRKARMIRIDKINIGKPQDKNVYILGTVNEGGETYYVDEFFGR